jgi:hypothetical protein
MCTQSLLQKHFLKLPTDLENARRSWFTIISHPFVHFGAKVHQFSLKQTKFVYKSIIEIKGNKFQYNWSFIATLHPVISQLKVIYI